MPRLFHVSEASIQAGTRLRPTVIVGAGEYNVLRNALLSGQHYLENLLFTEWAMNNRDGSNRWHLFSWASEVIYELVREKHFPQVPGRHGSVYLWEDIDTAAKFRADHKGGKGWIYECSVDRDQSSRRFDQNYWNSRILQFAEPLSPQIQMIYEDARAYYSQTPSQNPVWEILATVPVHVVKRH